MGCMYLLTVVTGRDFILPVINRSSKFCTLAQGDVLAAATQVMILQTTGLGEGISESLGETESAAVTASGADDLGPGVVRECVGEGQLPDHLVDLFRRSSKHLSDSQRGVLQQVLVEYQDVFFCGGSGLGMFFCCTA
jgi:hypothetical protein